MAPWGDRIGVLLTEATDWEEVGEIVAASDCLLAPKKLVALLDDDPASGRGRCRCPDLCRSLGREQGPATRSLRACRCRLNRSSAQHWSTRDKRSSQTPSAVEISCT
jgi:hypothetical protein